MTDHSCKLRYSRTYIAVVTWTHNCALFAKNKHGGAAELEERHGDLDRATTSSSNATNLFAAATVIEYSQCLPFCLPDARRVLEKEACRSQGSFPGQGLKPVNSDPGILVPALAPWSLLSLRPKQLRPSLPLRLKRAAVGRPHSFLSLHQSHIPLSLILSVLALLLSFQHPHSLHHLLLSCCNLHCTPSNRNHLKITTLPLEQQRR